MRVDEYKVNVATEWPSLPTNKPFKSLLYGVSVFMCPDIDKTSGGIYLPDRSRGNLKPDAGVVSQVSDPKMHGESLVDYIPLAEGDKVYVRPYVGLYYEVEDGMYRVFGKEQFRGDDKISKVPYWEHVLAKVVGDEVLPVGQNVIVKPHLLASTIAVEGLFEQKATVIAAGDETEWESGDVVLLKKGCEQLKWAMGGDTSQVMVYDSDIVRCIVEDS